MNTGVGMSPRRVCSSPARAPCAVVLNSEKPTVTASAHGPARERCQPLPRSAHEPFYARRVRVAGIACEKPCCALARALSSTARNERLDGHDLGLGSQLAIRKISSIAIGQA